MLAVPIVAGLLTALSFAMSALVSARASRLVGARVTVAGAMLVGLVIVLPAAVLASPLPPVPPGTVVLAILAGAMYVGGLLLAYTAFTIGAVGVVSTIASCDGAMTALIAVLAGEQLGRGFAPILGLIVLGVVLAATGGGREVEEGIRISRARSFRAAGLAACSATLFGVALFLTAVVGASLPTPWLLLPGRILGVFVLGIPLLVTGRARVTRKAMPFVVVCGIVEITGFTSFVIGAQVDIAVTSVLASMFAPIAAFAAFLLFGERLARRQIAGIALVVSGIALLGSASQ